MILHFNATGEDRKKIVEIVEYAEKMKAVYLRAPSMAYRVGRFVIGKTGSLEYDDADVGDPDFLEHVNGIINTIVGAGYTPEEWEDNIVPDSDGESCGGEDAGGELTIEVPSSIFTEEALANLRQLVAGKSNLMKAAFGAEELPINVEGDVVRFPWFRTEPDEDSTPYLRFIEKLCDMACTLKRVTAKERESTNPKYDFRCFLLRLGFIGTEYKHDRKVLLKNLSGSSAFKNGRKGQSDDGDVSGQTEG